MVKGKVTLKQTGDISFLKKIVAELANKEVLVGIPQENSSREIGDTINNAELLYIQSHGVRSKQMRQEMDKSISKGMKYSAAHSLYVKTHGSPMLNIPPRPVLEPSIEANKQVIAKQIAIASTAAMENNPHLMEEALNKAGMIATSAAQGWFENPANNWQQNAKSTIKKKGSNQPLVDTGEMRKAITYVLRDKL